MDIRIIGIVGKLKPDILKAPSDYARKALLCVARRHFTPPPTLRITSATLRAEVVKKYCGDQRLEIRKCDQPTYLPTNLLTWVGARDTCVSKNKTKKITNLDPRTGNVEWKQTFSSNVDFKLLNISENMNFKNFTNPIALENIK